MSAARRVLERWPEEGHQPTAADLINVILSAKEVPAITVHSCPEFGWEYAVTCHTLGVFSYRYRDSVNKEVVSQYISSVKGAHCGTL